jgi:exosortase
MTYTGMTKYIMYFLLAAAFIGCYYWTFGWLYYKYEYPDSYYSHGYLIPIVTAYLIYIERNSLKTLIPSSSIVGLAMVVLALMIHVAATMGDVNFLSGASMLLYIFGCTLYLYGRQITRQVLFPLAFLVFMFPIPDSFIDLAGLPSKALATTVGLKLVQIVDIPFFREGFQIHLPNSMLVVGTPCNGMKSMISFLAIGSLFLYLIEIKRWIGALIFLAIFPMALLLNGARVAMLVYIAYNHGIEKAAPDSYLHTLSGMVVFIAGMAVLAFLVKIGRLNVRKSRSNHSSDEEA